MREPFVPSLIVFFLLCHITCPLLLDILCMFVDKSLGKLSFMNLESIMKLSSKLSECLGSNHSKPDTECALYYPAV